MDALNSDTEYLFSLPVALIFQNESTVEEQSSFGYNTTSVATVNLSQSNHNWKREEIILSGFQRLEKVGDAIRRELKWAFILHAYGFGCSFFILAFYTFFSILNIRSFISSRPFMTTINGFLCLLGTSRAASLFIDPYSLKENMPKLFDQVLWDLGFPSIISAFCLVQLAFLQFTQLQIGPKGFRKKSCLSLIVTAHFLLTIGVDIVVASHENLLILKHMVHYVFLTWGVFLCSNFLYTGYKIMSMIKKISGEMKYKELIDPSYKGIIQLAILAPHNSLAGSMTAALLPTLCPPKIHQQDNTGLSAIGFRSDGNSRILESESIPMLEEMTASSGDEISPKSIGRGTPFQNQTRNFQKLNLRPKLSLRSVSSRTREEDSTQVKYPELNSPKSATLKYHSPKTSSIKTYEFDFNFKSNNGILKHKENFITTKSIHEFKNKMQRRTFFENENFHFTNENKSKGNNVHRSQKPATIRLNNFIPEIATKSDNSENDEIQKTSEEGDIRDERNKKTLCVIMNEISKDLNEMQILREEKNNKAEKIVEVHLSKRDKFESESENDLANKIEKDKYTMCREKRIPGYRKNSFRKQYEGSKSETATVTRESVTSCSVLTEITKLEEASVGQQKFRGRKKGKSLSWKMKMEVEKQKEEEEEEEEKTTQECLLLQENSEDVTLRSVLGHIAYVNRRTLAKTDSEDELEKVRKSKVEWVLNITYITAMWGLMLCLSNMGKIYSPFGVPEYRKDISFLNSTYLQRNTSTEENESEILLSSWPWLWFQTFCRALELAMGCAMANITRQPAANRRYSRTLNFRHRDTFYNI